MKLTPTEYRGVRGYSDVSNEGTSKFYPGSGSVLDILLGSSIGWIDQEDLDEGSRCHEEMKFCLTVKKEVGEWPVTFQSPRVKALVEHLADWKFIPVEAERSRCSTLYGYAGTPDALLRRGDLYVIGDWKFSQAIAERYTYQLLSYQHFFTHLEKKPALMLFQVNREAKVKPIAIKPTAHQWAEFLGALTCMKKRLR